MSDEWTDRVQRELEAKGFTNSDLASSLDITDGAVSRLLNGIGEPSFTQFEIVAKMLDMPVSELIGTEAIFVSDKHEIRAVELMQDIGADRKDLALKILKAFIL